MSRADRVALIAFAGRSYILTPLTSDDGALELFLDNLDPTVVGQAGSSLSRAIRQGTELLLSSDGGADRALIVMSDGEAFESTQDIEVAAREAGQKGVSLVTVGFGTLQGSTIPIRDGTVVREKRDDEGKIVVTHYDPKTLQAAARAAGGSFVDAGVSDKAARIRSSLRTLRTARRSTDSHEDHVPRFTWLLVPALLLLLLDSLMGERGARPVALASSAPGKLAAQLLLMCVFLGPVALTSCARSPDAAALIAAGDVSGALKALRHEFAAGDTTERTRYNLGSALLAADSLQSATELLETVRRSSEGEVQMRARFNAGLGELKQGQQPNNPEAQKQLASAVAAYKSYLLQRPGDVNAKWNYELALRTPPPSSGGGGGASNPKDQSPQDAQPKPRPGSLDPKQAEALLNSAAREEREVQGRKQKQGHTPPPGGKDW